MEGEKQQFIQLNPSQARKAKPSEYSVRPYHRLDLRKENEFWRNDATIVIAFQKSIKSG